MSIFTDFEITVQPVVVRRPMATTAVMIHVTTTLLRSRRSSGNSLSVSEDNQEDTRRVGDIFFMPVSTLDDPAVARESVSDVLSNVCLPSWLLSPLADKILRILSTNCRDVQVIVCVSVDGFPDTRRFVPASPEAILGLQNNKIRVSSAETCAVCLEDMPAGSEAISTLPCSHFYHEDCIVEWLRRNGVCPICRLRLN